MVTPARAVSLRGGVAVIGGQTYVATKGSVLRARTGSRPSTTVIADALPMGKPYSVEFDVGASDLHLAAVEREGSTLMAMDTKGKRLGPPGRTAGNVMALTSKGNDVYGLVVTVPYATKIVHWDRTTGVVKDAYVPPAGCDVNATLVDDKSLYAFESCKFSIAIADGRNGYHRVTRAIDPKTRAVRELDNHPRATRTTSASTTGQPRTCKTSTC